MIVRIRTIKFYFILIRKITQSHHRCLAIRFNFLYNYIMFILKAGSLVYLIYVAVQLA